MDFRYSCARLLGSASTWGLQTIFRREAGNFPGKVGLMVDPHLIRHLRSHIRTGVMVVVGTNGKTTVTNLIADTLENNDRTVICNRGGANMDSGIATALLQTDVADWGIIESDELWLAKTLPQLRANYVLLLNLFRDQLDRCGEIDHVQNSLVKALKSSPDTMLIYNADDPQCASIAARIDNPTLAFGVAEDLHLPQNSVSDAQMCQNCENMLEYDYRQYGQLGSYHCPHCGFARPELDYAVTNVRLSEFGTSLSITSTSGTTWDVQTPFGGAYMVYNMAAVAVAAHLSGCTQPVLQSTIRRFHSENGRLQFAKVAGRTVLLNLAKNPTGFNQNLKLVTQGKGPKVVAFFINDKEADGHDVSWLWDIDFEELAAYPNLTVYAGGIRAYDMQVRLKYAGIEAQIVESAQQVFVNLYDTPPLTKAFLIANYTALPSVKADVERLALQGERFALHSTVKPGIRSSRWKEKIDTTKKPVVIAHLFPDLLNLYGDGGNVVVLKRRLEWRGIPVEVRTVSHGEHIDLSQVDLVFLGGGPDREQHLASQQLLAMADQLKSFVEADGALLAICGGFQILGNTWLLGDEVVPGLGIIDMRTGRAEGGSSNRLINNVALRSDLAQHLVIGYENHAGRTYLGPEVQPFGTLASSSGHGNNDEDHVDGARYRQVIGTYLHGPLLSKNPEIADVLLNAAIKHWAKRQGVEPFALTPLDDEQELSANAFMHKRLHAE